MDETSSDFRDALVDLIDSSSEPMDHPSPDRWLAYQRGELPAEEEARLQEHLARCRDCFDLADGAAAFAQPEEPNAGQDAGSDALWRRLQPRLELPDNVREISAPRRRPFWKPRALSALAAALFLAVVGLTGWDIRLQSELAASRAPQPNAPIFDFSAGARAAAPPGAPEKTLSASTGPWMLVFHPADDLPVYRLAIRDATSGEELDSYVLRPNEVLALTFQLPEGLPPGHSRLELWTARERFSRRTSSR